MKICKTNHREVAYAQEVCPACDGIQNWKSENETRRTDWGETIDRLKAENHRLAADVSSLRATAGKWECNKLHVDASPCSACQQENNRLRNENDRLSAATRTLTARANEDAKENEKLAAKIRVQEGELDRLRQHGYRQSCELVNFRAANQALLDELNARKGSDCQRYDHSECTHKGTGATICRNQHGPIHFYTRNCPVCDLVGQNKFLRADWDKTNALQQEELEFLRTSLESSRKLASELSAKTYNGPCPKHNIVSAWHFLACTCETDFVTTCCRKCGKIILIGKEGPPTCGRPDLCPSCNRDWREK